MSRALSRAHSAASPPTDELSLGNVSSRPSVSSSLGRRADCRDAGLVQYSFFYQRMPRQGSTSLPFDVIWPEMRYSPRCKFASRAKTYEA